MSELDLLRDFYRACMAKDGGQIKGAMAALRAYYKDVHTGEENEAQLAYQWLMQYGGKSRNKFLKGLYGQLQHTPTLSPKQIKYLIANWRQAKLLQPVDAF